MEPTWPISEARGDRWIFDSRHLPDEIDGNLTAEAGTVTPSEGTQILGPNRLDGQDSGTADTDRVFGGEQDNLRGSVDLVIVTPQSVTANCQSTLLSERLADPFWVKIAGPDGRRG